MRNIYELEVRAQCPVKPDDTDLYCFIIESEKIIEVEKIMEFFDKNANKSQIFQEKLTSECAVALGAHVKSIGMHSGIKVTCIAP